MRKYFTYLLKKNLITLACLTLFAMLMYVLPISLINYSYWNDYPPFVYDVHYAYYEPTLFYGSISLVLACFSVFIPMYMFSYKMNKRSVDMYYSLPINKTNTLTANFLVGLILVYVPYTITYLLGFIAVAVKVKWLYLGYYIPLYFASLIPAFIMYAISSFIFTRANTTIDGFLSVFGSFLLPALIALTISRLVYNFDFGDLISGEQFFPFTPLMRINSSFGHAIITGQVDGWFEGTYRDSWDTWELISGILWTLVAVAFTVGLITSEKNSKAENCGQISESIFCYKVQVPVYVAMATIIAMSLEALEILLLSVIAFFAFLMGIAYKRTIKIGWKFTIVLALCMVGGILLYVIPTAII